MQDVLNQDTGKARALLKEAGYDGTPVVLLQATDVAAMANLAPVAKAQLEAAGFKVDMQPMAWQTVVARRMRKESADKGGWNALFTFSGAADILNPVAANLFNASCEKAPYGWPCDAEIERLRDAFSRETDPAKQKQIAMALQKHWVEAPTVRASRPALPAFGHAHDRRRHAARPGDGVLERHEEIGAVDWIRSSVRRPSSVAGSARSRMTSK
jgi:peptide/nickel transport system substrate-binding protein